MTLYAQTRELVALGCPECPWLAWSYEQPVLVRGEPHAYDNMIADDDVARALWTQWALDWYLADKTGVDVAFYCVWLSRHKRDWLAAIIDVLRKGKV